MTNFYKRLKSLFPSAAKFIGEIQSADHPNYKVLLVDGTGLVMCTSAMTWSVGQRVFISDQVIQYEAPSGDVVYIDL